MERTSFDPRSEMYSFFSRFMRCGFGGRRFYTRQERIDDLEQLKKRLQQEIAGIDELIDDLKRQQEKH